MRPIYETATDISREAGIAASLAACWDCRFQKMPKFYGVDFAALRKGEITAWFEIKHRFASYPSYRLSLHKWMRGIELSEITGKPAFIVVSWPVDGKREVIYRAINRDPVKVVLGGRKDRGDPDDIEPMVEIPVGEFKRVLIQEDTSG